MLQRKCDNPRKAAEILFAGHKRRGAGPLYMRHLANDWLKSSYNAVGQALHKIIDEQEDLAKGANGTKAKRESDTGTN